MAAKEFISRVRVAVLSLILICLTIKDGDYLFPAAEAIWLAVPTSGTKCISEEIQTNVVVLADYYLIDEHEVDYIPTVSVRVTSPFGNDLHNVKNVSHGQFAFTTHEAGLYLACFWMDADHQKLPLTLALDWKIGIATKDWDAVAKKEKLEGVELHLRRLAETVQAIRRNLMYLRYRESKMWEVSEGTNSKVARFSVVSLGVCIVASALQIWHLKRYFQKKKLI